MSAELHLDLVAVERAIAICGIQHLLELVAEDPPGIVIACEVCGESSFVPTARDTWTGRSFLRTFEHRHAGCHQILRRAAG